MAQGRKYDDETRETAFALLASGLSNASVSKKLGLPESTVRTWHKTWLQNGGNPLPKDRQTGEEGKKSLAELRAKKKQEFIDRAWGLIDESLDILRDRLKQIKEDGDKEDIRAISTVIGTLYDKQALANREATSIVDGEVKVTKFEEL